MTIKSPKKLIEVALPLDAINVAAAREKSIRHGHPSTLHLWWARRPLAAVRAVIFAQMVNDPGYQQGGGFRYGVNKEKAQAERERLFKIIEDLVQWENTNNEEVLERARVEIRRSWREVCELNKGHPQATELFDPDKLPAFHDPFAGGGALPLEAQRLGLEAYASDLNPVAVTINKAMIEIPPRFAGRAPVGPRLPGDRQGNLTEDWSGARGLAEDVRRYGAWMRAEAEKRIGHLYPQVEITPEMALDREDLKPLVGKKLTVIAWLWARTVKSPNPAFSHVDVPLASTFVLSSKVGKEAYVQPVVEGDSYRFTVRVGTPPENAEGGTKISRGAFRCLLSDAPMKYEYIDDEANACRMSSRLMAIVAEGVRGRVYLTPTKKHEAIARQAEPTWKPEAPCRGTFASNAQGRIYGFKVFGDYFTPRQLVALTTFSDLVAEAIEKCRKDAIAAGFDSSPLPHLPSLGEGANPADGQGFDSSPQRGEVGRSSHLRHGIAGFDSSPQRGEVGRGEEWQPTPVPPALLHAARELRKNMTDAEQFLWQCLRGKQLGGFRFRKQHPLDRYVLDFFCPAAKLAIELDGGQHNTQAGREKDQERTRWLNQQGIRVLRFWNDEVLKNADGVLECIWMALQDAPPPQPSPAGGGSENQSDLGLAADGRGALAYAQAIGVYVAFAISRTADRGSTICSWDSSPKMEALRNTFGRQAIPMTWDFAEGNPFSDSSGNWMFNIEWGVKAVQLFPARAGGSVAQQDAQTQTTSKNKLVSTDPPYYDNIGYADLSDFFYVWLRRSLKSIYPSLFATLAVPKAEELVATPYRHGGKEQAEKFFLDGMTAALHNLAQQANPAFPVTIYYAFKQSETKDEAGTSSTGWETFLEAVLKAGFALTGTWPMRTELGNRMIGSGTNALASSIVLVCRQRATDAPTTSRREFLRELNATLPEALDEMTRGGVNSPVAPVDLSQAIIGPGMAIFSQYAAVLEADGSAMSVRTALQLINRFLAEDDFDHDTQFCLHWFEQQGWATGKYGEADVLARAKGTSVGGLQASGVVESSKGELRLLKWAEIQKIGESVAGDRRTLNPKTLSSDSSVWAALHQLIRALNQDGESAAGSLLARMPTNAEPIRALAYRLYTLCERKGWAEEARAYNELVTAWSAVEQAAGEAGMLGSQAQLDI